MDQPQTAWTKLVATQRLSDRVWLTNSDLYILDSGEVAVVLDQAHYQATIADFARSRRLRMLAAKLVGHASSVRILSHSPALDHLLTDGATIARITQ